MKALVTGAGGLIGSECVRLLGELVCGELRACLAIRL